VLYELFTTPADPTEPSVGVARAQRSSAGGIVQASDEERNVSWRRSSDSVDEWKKLDRLVSSGVASANSVHLGHGDASQVSHILGTNIQAFHPQDDTASALPALGHPMKERERRQDARVKKKQKKWMPKIRRVMIS
jgi:hypothetical protein